MSRFVILFPAALALMQALSVLPAAADAGANLPVVAPVATCADLTKTDLVAIAGEGSAVTAAEEATSDGIPVCSVTGRLTPDIDFQVLLPTKTWTQRYLQVGCGGLCGDISLRSGASAGCKVLNDGGFVMGATDMGHTAKVADWGLDPARRTDFAHRAQHLTAQAAHALISAFYGKQALYSYFNGCSDGGREALMEAMRYPKDFDGVIAGAPAMMFQVQNTLFHGWMGRSNTDEKGETILTSEKLPALHRAVMAACDETDGVKDDLISQPELCTFDPATLACPSGGPETNDCLTERQLQVVRDFYAGPQDSTTGAFLTAGQPAYGSELNWQGVYVSDTPEQEVFSDKIVDPVLRYLAFDPSNPDFSLADLKFTTATLDALRPRHPLFDATNPDLTAFYEAGGKIILWHGLADPHIAPANTLLLHRALIAQMTRPTVMEFERLYFLPGVGHCGGGQGPANLDLLSAMLDWVENGFPPDAIITATTAETSSFGQLDGAKDAGGPPPMKDLGVAPLPEMTRPVFPHPLFAAYGGSGAVEDAANWIRGSVGEIVRLREWSGSDFFAPYNFAE